jgi:hypothetical protein
LQLSDQRFEVPAEQTLNIQTLTLTNINQQEVGQPVLIDLAASLGKFSTIVLKGEATLFAEPISMAVKGGLKAIDLPGISAYTEAALDYHLTREHYEHEFYLSIANDEITLDNTLKLRQLLVKSVDASKSSL